VLDKARFVLFLVSVCMLCWVRHLFVIATSAVDCLWRFVSKITYYVSSQSLYRSWKSLENILEIFKALKSLEN